MNSFGSPIEWTLPCEFWRKISMGPTSCFLFLLCFLNPKFFLCNIQSHAFITFLYFEVLEDLNCICILILCFSYSCVLGILCSEGPLNHRCYLVRPFHYLAKSTKRSPSLTLHNTTQCKIEYFLILNDLKMTTCMPHFSTIEFKPCCYKLSLSNPLLYVCPFPPQSLQLSQPPFLSHTPPLALPLPKGSTLHHMPLFGQHYIALSYI